MSKVGRLTPDQMEAHLSTILAKRPELRRLMAARVWSGESLRRATLEALGEWERAYGRSVRWRPAAELLKKTGDPANLMTLQGNELWIDMDAKVLDDPKAIVESAKRFHREVVHELAADSLGTRGTRTAQAYLEMANGQVWNDLVILESAILKGDLKSVIRFYAGG